MKKRKIEKSSPHEKGKWMEGLKKDFLREKQLWIISAFALLFILVFYSPHAGKLYGFY